MRIKGVDAKAINDSRGDETIEVKIKTDVGTFSASAPNGKSRGKFESKPYKKDLMGDIKALKKFSDYFSEEILESFEDLRRVEDIIDGHVGANTMVALDYAVLKAIAKEQKKEVWQIINPNLKLPKMPRPVGNCIGGGQHSEVKFRKPDFQEFELVPSEKKIENNFEKMLKAKKNAKILLEKIDKKFEGKKNDENAWITSLNEKEVFEVLKELNIPTGSDVAASSFYRRGKYRYENPKLDRTPEEQLGYLANLIKNYSLFYIEDPFEEKDFESFAKLLKKFPNSLIVGDDLTVTNVKRLKKAIQEKAINALIVKPNQNGSLMEVAEVVKLAKENGVKTIFSHRSGETTETIIADLAVGFEADFVKFGITGRERISKLDRLIQIEKDLKSSH